MDNTDTLPTKHHVTGTNGPKAAKPKDPKCQAALPPAWVRIPEAIRLTGISRSKLYELIRDGKIRSASLRDTGQSKATRLVSSESLLRFIDSHATGGTSET